MVLLKSGDRSLVTDGSSHTGKEVVSQSDHSVSQSDNPVRQSDNPVRQSGNRQKYKRA